MADYTVTITLQGRDNATQVFQQVTQQLGGMQQAQRQTGRATQETASAFDQLERKITGMITVGAAIKIAEMGFEMAELGDEVADTQAAFEALSGGAAAYTANLEALRAGTRGTIDDLDLMKAGQKALSLGIVETAEDMAQMAELASGLGGIFGGMEGADALNRWTDMLANRTTRSLRDFGISAEVVQNRVKELTAEGLSDTEAFTRAVEEQANVVKNRLGPAFEGAFDPIDKLTTRWENFWQAASVNVAAGAEGFLSFVDALIQRFQRGAEEGEDFLEVLREIAGGVITNTLFNEPSAGVDRGRGNLMAQLEGLRASYEEQLAASNAQGGSARQQMVRGRDIQAQLDLVNEAIAEQQAFMRGLQNQDVASSFGETVRQRERERGEFGTQSLQAFHAAESATILEREAEAQLALGDASDEARNALDAFANPLRNVTEQTNLAAEAVQRFADMGLAEIFGTGGGGRTGEIADAVIEAMRAGGTSDLVMGQTQRALDLATGRETSGSLALTERVAPAIATLDADAAVRAVENLNEFMSQAALLGIDVGALSAQQMMAGAGVQTHFVPGVGEITRETAGFDPLAQARELQTELERAGDAASVVGDNLKQPFTEVVSKVQTVRGELEAINGMRLSLEIVPRINAGDPAAMAAFQMMMAQSTARNGGVPPGSDPRGNAQVMTAD